MCELTHYYPWVLPLESYVCENGIMYLSSDKPSSFTTQKQVRKRLKRNVTPLQKKLVGAKQKWDCAICQQRLLACYEVDHIIPLWAGGSNDFENLQALCRNCHGEKTLRDLHIYAKVNSRAISS